MTNPTHTPSRESGAPRIDPMEVELRAARSRIIWLEQQNGLLRSKLAWLAAWAPLPEVANPAAPLAEVSPDA